jgi:hypothetical protein
VVPVIIIGAPRSGTNMLRDVLTSFSGVVTWPCDEINYIWRHGNIFFPSDEIPSVMATENVKSYIRKSFQEIAQHTSVSHVVEKTCANSLRVPFVDCIFPDAKYIFIVRDGLDVVSSAMDRWKAPLALKYLMYKVRFVPISDLPYYGLRYLWSRIYRFFSAESRIAFWGPQLSDMKALLDNHSLLEVCGLQWQRCVELAEQSLSTIDSSRVIRIRYEDFVAFPDSELFRILDFMGIESDEENVKNAVAGVSKRSVSKGKNQLKATDIQSLDLLIGDTLRRLGYGIERI